MAAAQSFYLATAPGGRLFYADGPAAEGAHLTAVYPEAPFRGRGIYAARTPSEALGSPQASWPFELWIATGTPDRDLSRGLGGTVASFRALTVTDRLDPSVALGGHGQEVIDFLESIQTLRACDLRQMPTLEEEAIEASTDDEDYDSSDHWQALTRIFAAAKDGGLQAAQECASSCARKRSLALVEQLFDVRFRAERTGDPYPRMKSNLQNATYCAASGLVVSHLISDADRDVAFEDWKRLTGRSLA
jgi:hypothetical protein